MRSHLTRVILVLALSAIAHPAVADCSAGDRCQNVRITRLVTDETGASAIQISSALTGLTCAVVPGTYINLDMTQPYSASVYSHILSAHLAGKPLTVRVTTGGWCRVLYVYSDN